ncbi:hypothetical protein BH10ACT3_BH10ACT3_23160 [soil metagenome]
METNPPRGTAETLTSARIEEDFISLLCDDKELLDREFTSIVAFNWGDVPPGEPPNGSGSAGAAGLRPSRNPDDPIGLRRAGVIRRVDRWTLPRAPPNVRSKPRTSAPLTD